YRLLLAVIAGHGQRHLHVRIAELERFDDALEFDVLRHVVDRERMVGECERRGDRENRAELDAVEDLHVRDSWFAPLTARAARSIQTAVHQGPAVPFAPRNISATSSDRGTGCPSTSLSASSSGDLPPSSTIATSAPCSMRKPVTRGQPRPAAE